MLSSHLLAGMRQTIFRLLANLSKYWNLFIPTAIFVEIHDGKTVTNGLTTHLSTLGVNAWKMREKCPFISTKQSIDSGKLAKKNEQCWQIILRVINSGEPANDVITPIGAKFVWHYLPVEREIVYLPSFSTRSHRITDLSTDFCQFTASVNL